MDRNEVQNMIDSALVKLCHRINELYVDDESDFSLAECIDIAGREVDLRMTARFGEE